MLEVLESGTTEKNVRFRDTVAAGVRAVSLDGWAVLATSVAAAGLFGLLGYLELLVLACALAVAWLIAALLALRGSGVSVRRTVVPHRIIEGETARALLTIANSGRVRAPPSLAIEQFDGRELPIPLPSIGIGSEHIHTYPLDGSRRGRFRVGPLRLGRADPFRFFRSAKAEGELAELLVHPVTYDVPPVQAGRVRDLEGITQSRRAQGGIAFHNLREYVPGDDLRLIHWRSSAKTGTLMVKHNVVTHEPSIVVVLDTSSVYRDRDAFEDAVRIAGSLVVSGVGGGFPTYLHTTSGYGGFVPPAGEGLTKVLDLLADVRISRNDEGLAYLAKLTGSGSRDSTLEVVTGVPNSALLSRVAKVAGRFDAANTVIVGDWLERSAPTIKGSYVMRTANAEAWARARTARFQ